VHSSYLKVPRGEAELVRKELIALGFLDLSLRIRQDGESILIPVSSLEAGGLGFPLGAGEFEGRELVETDYRKIADVPEEIRERLPVSFDVIGDVAIIKLEDELLPFARTIGQAMKTTFPRLRSVALDRGVKGELRVRDLEVIAGQARTETVHTEYGLRLLVDPAKVYFNPRLGGERHRITSLVRDGEVVVDMFAGVGPFSIMIAKYARPEAVVAIDLNHDAVEYLKRNIVLNKVSKVIPLEGDALELIYQVPCADRIIMNLPHLARVFFADALTRLKMEGTIHFYHICERGEMEDLLVQMIVESRGMGVKVVIDRVEELKTYSPSMSVFSADLRLAGWL
jgi:tRNA (guanine37-N1)-methyltransferase